MKSKTAEYNKRWRLIAHTGIQGGLILRMLIYWLIFQGIGAGAVILLSYLSSGAVSAAGCLMASTAATFLVLPILVLDLVEFSNRFAGPVHSLANRLVALSEGKRSYELKLRKKDFYEELVIPFNRIRANILEQRQKHNPTRTREDHHPDLDLDSTFPELSMSPSSSTGE